MSSAPTAAEDADRIQALTTQGRHLAADEFDEAVKMYARLRAEVAQDPKKLRIYQYAAACFLIADETKVSQLHAKDSAWRKERESEAATKASKKGEDFAARLAARNAAKYAQLEKDERQRKEELKKRVAENEARMKQRGVRRAAEVAPAAPAISSPAAPAMSPPAAPTLSPPNASAPQKKWKPTTYDPDKHRSAVKRPRSGGSHSFVKGKYKEKRNRYKMRA